jgi:hypothetical protein
MKTIILTVFVILIIPFSPKSQTYSQYFDGADTSAWNSLIIQPDTSVFNVWQAGPPQKAIFDSAATLPNAMVTDTINFYPPNNLSRFSFTINSEWFGWGILALQWKQKLDMDHDFDGGIIEFTTDMGDTWQNVFNNPYVYAFYGYDTANVDLLQSGDYAFSGTDEEWKDIWLCFDVSWLSYYDTLTFRYTLMSDGSDNQREGWMIDNMIAHLTIIHTVDDAEQEEYMMVKPNPTTGKIDIQTKKRDDFHIIEQIDVMDMNGRMVKQYKICPTKFSINLADQPNGIYFLRIKTNIQTETFNVILQK